MSFSAKDFMRHALAEDLGHGDITSSLVIGNEKACAQIIAKEEFVLAGIPFVRDLFEIISGQVSIEVFVEEGAIVKRQDIIARLTGRAKDLLAGERVALNILQRLSGTATTTRNFAEKVKDLPLRIVDTRKTTPGMRVMEKYAVTVGGAYNHRFGLYDGILIKDNHIKLAGGVKQAVARAKISHHLLKIEVEVGNIEELEEALAAGADVIMLDNMPVEEMKKAVGMVRSRNNRIVIEASGNVNPDNIREIALTGVDIISVGALTHSARAVDISMKITDCT